MRLPKGADATKAIKVAWSLKHRSTLFNLCDYRFFTIGKINTTLQKLTFVLITSEKHFGIMETAFLHHRVGVLRQKHAIDRRR